MNPIHLLEADTTATGHSRLTCTTCDTALVRQPYMTDSQWKRAQVEFNTAHPVPSDPTEAFRRVEVEEINHAPGSREALEATRGQVWDTAQLIEDFEVVSFLAPYVYVQRRADGVKGTLMFQHDPRFYFSFAPA